MLKQLSINIIITLTIFILMIISFRLVSGEKNRLFQKRSELASLKEDLRQLDLLFSQIKANQEELSFIQKTLPGSYQDIAFAILQTERLAKEANQELATQIPEDKTKSKKYHPGISVIQKTSGSYQDYSAYLSKVAGLPYHTRVKSLNIKSENSRISTTVNYQLFIGDKIK